MPGYAMNGPDSMALKHVIFFLFSPPLWGTTSLPGILSGRGVKMAVYVHPVLHSDTFHDTVLLDRGNLQMSHLRNDQRN
jgi:hypothetical protein